MICGCIGIIAEVSEEALKKRYDQGWVLELINDLDALVARVRTARYYNTSKHATLIEFYMQILISMLNTGPRRR